MSSNHLVTSVSPYIRIHDLRFRYPGMHHDALSMPSLEIDQPGLVAVTGPSGAGKSTLMELLAGTLGERYTGSVQVLGKEWTDLRGDRSRQFHLRRIALIPQDLGLLPSQTPRQMLIQALLDADVARSECDDRVLRALSRMELGQYADRRIAEMSGGQKQRVAIARALVRNVELILADEPTANLNPQLADETIAILRRIGQTIPIVVVTHDPRIAELCDRTIKLTPPVPAVLPALAPVALPAARFAPAAFVPATVRRMPAPIIRTPPAPVLIPAAVTSEPKSYRKLAIVSTAAACGAAAMIALLVAGLSSGARPIQTQTLTAVAPVVAPAEPSPIPSASPTPVSVPVAVKAPVTVVAPKVHAATVARTTPRVTPAPVVVGPTPAPMPTVQATQAAVQPAPTPTPALTYLNWWQQFLTPPNQSPAPTPSPTG